MTLTIEIPDEGADRVRDAAIARGQDMGTFVVVAVLAAASADSVGSALHAAASRGVLCGDDAGS